MNHSHREVHYTLHTIDKQQKVYLYNDLSLFCSLIGPYGRERETMPMFCLIMHVLNVQIFIRLVCLIRYLRFSLQNMYFNSRVSFPTHAFLDL